MKKYMIFQMFSALFFFNVCYGQGFATSGSTSTSTVSPITVDEGTSGSGFGVSIWHGAFFTRTSTALGNLALGTTISAINNTAIGLSALGSQTTGNNNTAVGVSALAGSTTGHENTALGRLSMQSIGTGFNNTGLGHGTLGSNAAGNSNTAVGSGSLGNGGSGDNNTCVGVNSGLVLTGNSNVVVGMGALNGATSGASNVALGFSSLNGITTGSNNVGIGFQSNVPNATSSHQLSIQNVIYGTNMNTLAGGKIGIGTTTPAVQFHTTAGVRFDGLTTGIVTRIIAQDVNNNLLAVSPTSIANVNLCSAVGTIPLTANANGNMDCSIINQISSNIGIDVPSPVSKLDIDCIAHSGNGHIRLSNLTLYPQTDPPINYLLIDSNGDVWRSNTTGLKSQIGSPTIDIDQNEIIQEQQTALDHQEIKIANQQTEINELRNKMNQLVPGCVTVKADNFQITPNPVTGTSTVSYKIDAPITNAVFIVYDLQGKMIRKYSVDKNAKEGQVQISKKDFGNGMYILSLVANNQEIQSKHFIISE